MKEEDVRGVGVGGGGGGAVGHSEHVAAGTVRSITQTQRGFKPCRPFFPRKMKKKTTTPKQSYKKKPKTKQQGSVDGRRMHGVMLPMGHCMYFDHARLMVALVTRYRGW